MVSRSRSPPPSCTGIWSPTARMTALTAASLTGRPASAPFKSTRCSRRAPAPSQRRAIAAGSSPKVVAAFMSPCSRRTHLPSLRSIAGINSMAEGSSGAGGSRRLLWCAGLAGRDGAAFETAAALSWRPGEEVPVEGQTVGGALLWVELGGKNVIPCDGTGKGAAVVGVRRGVAFVRRSGVITVQKVEPPAVGHVAPHRVASSTGAALPHLVPAHLRQLEVAAVALQPALQLEAQHTAGDQPEPRRVLLVAVVEQHLHAD